MRGREFGERLKLSQLPLAPPSGERDRVRGINREYLCFMISIAVIKSSGNKATEIKLADIFRQNKIVSWRRNIRLPGNPNFAFPSTVGAKSL